MTRGLGARLAPTLALLALLTLAGVAGLRGGPATDTPASGAVHQPEIGARLAATSHADPAAAAARWLAGQLVDGGLPGFVGTDWGLTIDALFALQAIGTEPKAVTAVTDALAASADEYAAFRSEAGDFITGGATAKILVAAVVAGQDPTDFGGYDWRQRTLELVHGPGTGAPSGWLFNRNLDATTGANMFDQSLAVIGLARSGGVDQSLVDFLITQQCPDGGFRLYPGAAGTPCADDPPAQQVTDVDTTAYALQALLAAAETGATGTAEPITRATDWLLAVQHSDGSFIGSVVTAYPNTNSTGLAAQALAAVGETAAAAKAAEFTLALQLTQEDGERPPTTPGRSPTPRTRTPPRSPTASPTSSWTNGDAQAPRASSGWPRSRSATSDPAPSARHPARARSPRRRRR